MKIRQLQKELASQQLDTILLLNSGAIDPSVFYFSQIDLERAFLIISKNSASLFTTPHEVSRAQQISPFKKAGSLPKFEELAGMLKGNVGVNYSYFPLGFAEKLKEKGIVLKDASQLILGLRATKTKEEIDRIMKACASSDEIIEQCISEFKTFKTEDDARTWLRKKTAEKGLEVSFPPIVASGKNAAVPHYSSSEKLRKGFCVIDFGVKYKGYCSDTTRTIYLGKPSQKEILLYNKVLETQENTEKLAKPGISMEALENFSRKCLGDLNQYFIHSLGHSVGIEVHDPLDKKTALSEGMIVTIEPGIYIKDRLGIRIEDTILIKKNTMEILTKISKELKCI